MFHQTICILSSRFWLNIEQNSTQTNGFNLHRNEIRTERKKMKSMFFVIQDKYQNVRFTLKIIQTNSQHELQKHHSEFIQHQSIALFIVYNLQVHFSFFYGIIIWNFIFNHYVHTWIEYLLPKNKTFENGNLFNLRIWICI